MLVCFVFLAVIFMCSPLLCLYWFLTHQQVVRWLVGRLLSNILLLQTWFISHSCSSTTITTTTPTMQQCSNTTTSQMFCCCSSFAFCFCFSTLVLIFIIDCCCFVSFFFCLLQCFCYWVLFVVFQYCVSARVCVRFFHFFSPFIVKKNERTTMALLRNFQFVSYHFLCFVVVSCKNFNRFFLSLCFFLCYWPLSQCLLCFFSMLPVVVIVTINVVFVVVIIVFSSCHLFLVKATKYFLFIFYFVFSVCFQIC